MTEILPASFYDRDVVEVARDLLGKRLVRCLQGERLCGVIVETEAYRGEGDLACHARAGKTARNAVMYGPAGHAYVYFTYGMHWLLNCVTAEQGNPQAVLLRAVVPLEGLETIARRRGGQPRMHWCDGPARLCQAFGITGVLNGASLVDAHAELWIEEGQAPPPGEVRAGPRVGIERVPDPWRSMPWRFVARYP